MKISVPEKEKQTDQTVLKMQFDKLFQMRKLKNFILKQKTVSQR